MSLLKIWPVYKYISGCDYHRVQLPFEHGAHWTDQQLMHEVDLKDPNLPEIMCSKVDLVVANRTGMAATSELKRMREMYNFKYVVDMDDDVNLPTYHVMFDDYRRSLRAKIIEQIQMADLLTVTTEYLAEQLYKYNHNVEVLPNSIPFQYGQFQQFKRNDNPYFNFIYAGQTSHLEDVKLMDSAMRAAKNHLSGIARVGMAGMKPNKVEYKAFGQRPTTLQPAIVKDMFKTFAAGPNPFKIMHLPLNQYMHLYDNMDCSLVPLTIDTFNFAKSNLKVLEAAAKGIPAIVSHVKPYSFDWDAPVFWIKENNEWFKAMKYLATNQDEAKAWGARLRSWAMARYNMDDVNEKRFRLYYKLVGKTFPEDVT